MTFVVTCHVATAIEWNPTPYISRIVSEIREPVGIVRAVGFDHARRKAAAKYPTVERELLRVTIA